MIKDTERLETFLMTYILFWGFFICDFYYIGTWFSIHKSVLFWVGAFRLSLIALQYIQLYFISTLAQMFDISQF